MTDERSIYVLSWDQIKKLMLDVGKAKELSRRSGKRVTFPTGFVPLAQFTPADWASIVQAIIEVKLDEVRKGRIHG